VADKGAREGIVEDRLMEKAARLAVEDDNMLGGHCPDVGLKFVQDVVWGAQRLVVLSHSTRCRTISTIWVGGRAGPLPGGICGPSTGRGVPARFRSGRAQRGRSAETAQGLWIAEEFKVMALS